MKIKRLIFSIWIMNFITPLFGQTSANHAISIRVIRTNQFVLEKQDAKNPSPVPVQSSDTDRPSYNLDWKTSNTHKKITVASTDAASRHSVILVAQNTTGADESYKKTLGSTAIDLINGMSDILGNCSVKFISNRNHNNQISTVIYTLTDS